MNSINPLISVIIPCYNAEKHLEVGISSIINQTYKNLEIIIIDDGSTDNTSSILKELSLGDARIKLFPNKGNLGLIETLNKGIDLATGDYIARMDADDKSHTERIEIQIKYLINNPEIDILGTNAFQISKDEKINKNRNPIFLEPTTLMFSSYFTQPFVHGSIIAKSPVLKNNKYDKNFKHSEDFELWLRLVNKGFKLRNIDQYLYYYLQNESGVSITHETEQIDSHNKASYTYLKKNSPLLLSQKTVNILNNRPSDDISYLDYKESIKLFFSLSKGFPTTSESRKFFNFQLLNIRIQSIKTLLKTRKPPIKLIIETLLDFRTWLSIYLRFTLSLK